jgi:hypothetical protein
MLINEFIVAGLINHGVQIPLGMNPGFTSVISSTLTPTTSQLPSSTTQPEESVLDQFMEELSESSLSTYQCLLDSSCRKNWWEEKVTSWREKLSSWTFDTSDDDDAPYCWLYSYEDYWPSLMQEHLEHTTPFQNYDPLDEQVSVDDLEKLNEYGYRSVFLTSNDNAEEYPYWMGSQDNIPDDQGYSPAPAVLIVVDKGAYVDAFWFFWYSFNLGNQVLGVRFGNHIGDWEHTMIRFNKRTGKPTQVFFSEHEWGAGYNWEDCNLEGNRVSYQYLSLNSLLIP